MRLCAGERARRGGEAAHRAVVRLVSERRGVGEEWFASGEQVRYVDDAVRADDCSAYLAYIVVGSLM